MSDPLTRGVPVALVILCPLLFALSDVRPGEASLDLDRFTTVREGMRIIHIPSGTYSFSETIRLPSGTVLEGEGPGTVLKAAPLFRGSRVITNAGYRKGNSHIRVRSLRIEFSLKRLEGESPGVLRFENVRDLAVENVVLDLDTPYYGIDLAAGTTACVIGGCTVVNKGGGGIMLRNGRSSRNSSSEDIAIRNNHVTSVKDEAVASFGWLGKVGRVFIRGNVIDAHDASFGITVYGIDRAGHTGEICDVHVEENTISGGRVGGIAVKGGAGSVSVERNIIRGQENDGIFIHAGGTGLPEAHDVSVKGNIIGKTGRHGILACGNSITVEANTIRNPGGCGVYVGGSVSVTKNTIVDARPGILIATSLPHTVRDNRIIGSGGIIARDNE